MCHPSRHRPSGPRARSARSARPEDAGPAPVIVESTPEHRSFVQRLSASAFGRFGDYESTLPALMGRPGVGTVIAEIDGAPVGFAMTSTLGGRPARIELTAIAVLADRRGRGVGSRLLAHVESRARRFAGAGRPASVLLTVALDNEPARRLFAAAGYTRIAGPPGRYPGGQASADYRKTVPA